MTHTCYIPSPAFPLLSRLVYPLISTDSYQIPTNANPNSRPTPKTCSPCGFPCLRYWKFHPSSTSSQESSSHTPHPINQEIMSVLHTHTYIHIHSLRYSLSTHHMPGMFLNTWVHEKKEKKKSLPSTFLIWKRGSIENLKQTLTSMVKYWTLPWWKKEMARKSTCPVPILPESPVVFSQYSKARKETEGITSGMEDVKQFIHEHDSGCRKS